MLKEDIMNIEKIKKSIDTDLEHINKQNELNDIKSKYLGKEGVITLLQSKIREIPNEEKKEYGIKVNEEVEVILVSMGYDVVPGNEVETDEYCFKRLNVPEGHPARDAQDTFYIDTEYLLRTQTSCAQAHTMEEKEDKGPIRIICPGKVYRRDDDATHSHQFGQVEGQVIDKYISLADLKGTLEIFAKRILGDNTKVRFRPSYFPFTEPSVEVDLSCFKCGGRGCALCKNTGWIEVLGAGMVHPNVLRMGGYDPVVYSVYAYGTVLD